MLELITTRSLKEGWSADKTTGEINKIVAMNYDVMAAKAAAEEAKDAENAATPKTLADATDADEEATGAEEAAAKTLADSKDAADEATDAEPVVPPAAEEAKPNAEAPAEDATPNPTVAPCNTCKAGRRVGKPVRQEGDLKNLKS